MYLKGKDTNGGKNMFSNFIKFKEELADVLSLFESPVFNYPRTDVDISEINKTLKVLNSNKNNLIHIFSLMDDEDIINALQVLGREQFENSKMVDSPFRKSIFKLFSYELLLYILSFILMSGRYSLFSSIVLKKYMVLQGPYSVAEQTFFELFGIKREDAGNIKEINGSEQDLCVSDYLHGNLNNKIATFDDLASCDLILTDMAILHDCSFAPYCSIKNIKRGQSPILALLIKEKVKANIDSACFVFGFDDKDKLGLEITRHGSKNFYLLSDLRKNPF